MWPIIAALAAKAIGSWLSNKGKAKQTQAAYDAQKPYQEQNNERTALRGALAGGMAKAYGIENLFAPGTLDHLATPVQVPAKAPGNQGWMSQLVGDELGDLGSGILGAQRQAGPPAPKSGASGNFQQSILNGGTTLTRRPRPVMFNPADAGSADPYDDTDYSKLF